MNAFETATRLLFLDPHLSLAAIYRAGAAPPDVPVRIIRRAPDRIASFGEGRLITDSVLIDVPVASVPTLMRGDTFDVGAARYEVRGDPVRDADRLIWSVEARAL